MKPYRWLPRTVWKNLSHVYWDLKNGLNNCVIFFEAVWRFRRWDWTGMVKLLEVSAQQMRKSLDKESVKHVGWERDAKQLLVVENLCKRLRADDYFTQAGHDSETWNTLSDFERRKILEHSEYMSHQDVAYLGKMFKFVQHWWN